MTWETLFTHWRLVEADLADRCGVDLEDRDLMRARSWRWLRVRITSLVDVPPAGFYEVAGDDGTSTRRLPLWATRLQAALHPPT